MMISENTFPRRFTKIDKLTQNEHGCLSATDECYYLGEYTPRRGFAHSTTNDLIFNFKKSVGRRDLPEWRYKDMAIQTIVGSFAHALCGLSYDMQVRLSGIGTGTLYVPIPPSRAKDDDLYDDRLVVMLNQVICPFSNLTQEQCRLDVRELVVRSLSSEPAHCRTSRQVPTEIEAEHEIDESLTVGKPPIIAIVDDVLTTGAHFKAMKNMLSRRFPHSEIIGLFIARSVRDDIRHYRCTVKDGS